MVFELGFGNGCIYDYLCEIYLNKEIFVFDFVMECYLSCVLDVDYMIFGNIWDMLVFCVLRVGVMVVFVYIDIGLVDFINDFVIVVWLFLLMNECMVFGGFILMVLELDLLNFEKLEKFEGIYLGCYYIYCKIV